MSLLSVGMSSIPLTLIRTCMSQSLLTLVSILLNFLLSTRVGILLNSSQIPIIPTMFVGGVCLGTPVLTETQADVIGVPSFSKRIDFLLLVSVLRALEVGELLQWASNIIHRVAENPRNHSDYASFVLRFPVNHLGKEAFGLGIMGFHPLRVFKGLNLLGTTYNYSLEGQWFEKMNGQKVVD